MNLVSVVVLIMVKEERTQRLQEIEVNRAERQNKRRIQRQLQTQNFYKSLHMLQAATFLRDHESESTSTPFEDYSLFLYRQNAPEFLGRVKELEQKLLYPVSEREERIVVVDGLLECPLNHLMCLLTTAERRRRSFRGVLLK